MRFRTTTTLLLVLAAVDASAAPPAASADSEAALRAQIAREPSVSQVVQASLRYFRVHPDALDSLRSTARARALLPILAGGFRYDDDKLARVSTQSPTPLDANENSNTRTNSFTAGAVWDLRELVFNPSEVQVYGLVGVQRDLMMEATRTYYLRRQLLLRMMHQPPEDPLSRDTLKLRIDEFTALLDVLTGGWFTEASAGKRE